MADVYSRDELMAKIESLLKLAERAGTKAEAETALAMAHRLMMKHAIEEHEVRNRNKEEVVYKDLLLRRGKVDKYQYQLICHLITEYFNVTVYTYRFKHEETLTYVFGTPDNCDFAQYVYNFLCTVYENLWNKLREEKPYLQKEHSRSYYVGLSVGFESTLKKEQENYSQVECTALMVIGKELEDATKYAHPELKQTAVKFHTDNKKKFFPNIHNRGIEDGKKIKIAERVESPEPLSRID